MAWPDDPYPADGSYPWSDKFKTYIDGAATAASDAAVTATEEAEDASGSAETASDNATAAAGSATAAAASATTAATAATNAQNAQNALNNYAFDTTTTMAAPGNGLIRFNSATVASVTAMALPYLDSGSTDLSAWIKTWDDSGGTPHGYLAISGAANHNSIWAITALTDDTTWIQLAVTYISGVIPSSGEKIQLRYSRTGEPGSFTIDGLTDIGATPVDADEIPVYQVSAAANRKSTFSRVWTYVAGKFLTSGALPTASMALVSDASQKVTASTTTATELGYVQGVTSAIQTQLNALVTLATTQTITALKTFSILPQSSAVPSAGNDLTNKTYVDTLVTGTFFKTAVRFALTEADVTDPTTVKTGDTRSGLTTATGDRFTFAPTAAATTAEQIAGGIYVVGASGSTRADDYDGSPATETQYGDRIPITAGTYAGYLAVVSGGTGAITIGTSQMAMALLPSTYTADGVTVALSGNVFSVKDGGVNATKMNVDGSADIGDALASGDEFVVYDASATANRKSAVSRIWDFIVAYTGGSQLPANRVANVLGGTDLGADVTAVQASLTKYASANSTAISSSLSDLASMTVTVPAGGANYELRGVCVVSGAVASGTATVGFNVDGGGYGSTNVAAPVETSLAARLVTTQMALALSAGTHTFALGAGCTVSASSNALLAVTKF